MDDLESKTPRGGEAGGVDGVSSFGGDDGANLSKDELLTLRRDLTYFLMDVHNARASGLVTGDERQFAAKAVGRIKCLIDTLAYSEGRVHEPR